MRLLVGIFLSLFISVFPILNAAEYKAANSAFLVNFSKGWSQKDSLDPDVILRLEKKKSFFEFSKLESRLGNHYLKARVKEQVESLRAKGSSIAGGIERVSIRGISTLYYTAYESMGYSMYIGFFTYKDASYAVSAKGIGRSTLKSIMYTFRKPGEKIIIKKPKPKPGRRRRKKTVSTGSVFRDADNRELNKVISKLSDSTSMAFSVKAASAAGKITKESGVSKSKISFDAKKKKFVKTKPKIKKKPLIARTPLPFYIWLIFIGLWLIMAPMAKNKADGIKNPKIPPPPKDVPPDFFFPFLISRFTTSKDIMYNIVTRQKQNLSGYFFNEHEFYFALGFYGLVITHVFWSFSIFIEPNFFVKTLLKLPFGGFFSSFPEIVFLLPIFKGILSYCKNDRVLEISDALRNPIVNVKKDDKYYALLRDGKGKEVGFLVKSKKNGARNWDFVDNDDQIVFAIKDEHPEIYVFRKLLGNLGGKLRSRYAIYAGERFAGFVLIDPTSKSRFQIHLDFAFSRLAHPAHIMGSILYILSKERDLPYPAIFW